MEKANIEQTIFKLITDVGNGFYSWNGSLYRSDMIRAAIRPTVQAVGKAVAKHIREDKNGLKVNPEPYLRTLLEEPNGIMTGQMLQEKLATQLLLNNNAFAVIQRDRAGYPTAIFPVNATMVEALQNGQQLYLRFYMQDGRPYIFTYDDVIHLRRDFNGNQLFGSPSQGVLQPLMEIVSITDQGIVKAIKNSNTIRWLLKFMQNLRPEDITAEAERFGKAFLDSEKSDSFGVAAVDAKTEATQVQPTDYVPNAAQMDRTRERVYAYFNTNQKITQASYNENEWISYYEANIEPIVVQMAGEYTRKLFTRRERGFGNRIIFESSNLTYASMSTKLQLVALVDRGILSPNEVRKLLNYAPVEGGDTFVRRLDTAEIGKENDNGN